LAKRLLIETRNEAEDHPLRSGARSPEPGMEAVDRREQAAIDAARDRLAGIKQGTDLVAIRDATLRWTRPRGDLPELMMEAAGHHCHPR